MKNADVRGSTAILVLGMHRSGTSACTRVINMLGAELGSSFLQPAADNPAGFWEHLGAYEIHERLLKELDRTWSSVSEMPEGWLELPAAQVAIEELAELCRSEFAGVSLWAVKDPRMCRLVPLWLAALDRVDCRARALFVSRSPLEVAESLRSREGMLAGHSHLMWVQHLLEAERFTRSLPRSIVSYDGLVSDWRGSMARVADELNIVWPHAISDVSLEVDRFIDPNNLRHHRHRDVPANTSRHVGSVFVDSLYATCLNVEAGRTDWSVFQQFQNEYQRAKDLFALPIADNEGLIDQLHGDVHIWEAEARSVRKKLDASEGLVDQLHRDVNIWEAEARSVQAKLQEEIANANMKLTAVKTDLAASQAGHAATRDELAVKELELNVMTGELQDTSERLNAAAAELDQLRANTMRKRWLLAKLFGR
ncbi:hypothetical protein [Rhodanobacter sp. MP7CTX1]|uniref:hypothetical protein n=1 Tax=Rhodanobacter sp. MP7CTX1 TaxID=2723084 RepID=UPI001615235F|nr:hypothetical protein [Rhodanobacter sp. MP7CTX1]MBB6187495.1 hypothetical protein [Rhodanobacter sp. MP7CTX1]